MIRLAKNRLRDAETEFIVADAETIDLNEKFDLITSNASFQWFDDLEKTIAKYRRLLKENGVILFSVLGSLTLHELNTSLRKLFKDNTSITSRGFAEKEDLKVILKK